MMFCMPNQSVEATVDSAIDLSQDFWFVWVSVARVQKIEHRT